MLPLTNPIDGDLRVGKTPKLTTATVCVPILPARLVKGNHLMSGVSCSSGVLATQAQHSQQQHPLSLLQHTG